MKRRSYIFPYISFFIGIISCNSNLLSKKCTKHHVACAVQKKIQKTNVPKNIAKTIVTQKSSHQQVKKSETLSKSADEPKLLLIIGCGRSGTMFTTDFLNALGLKVKHERIGQDGSVSWPMVVNSHTPWGPYDNEVVFKHIFHQVRNPLHVMTSWFINLNSVDREEWQFVRKHLPEINYNDSILVHCAKYWYYWNLKAEQRAEWRFRLEDMEGLISEFEHRLAITFASREIPRISHLTNNWTSTEKKITWADLRRELPADLYENIQAMALNYGYPITD